MSQGNNVSHHKVRKNMPGRRTKLDDDLMDEIVENIRIGAYVETAAAAAGINKDTFYRWLKRGKRAIQAHGDVEDVPEEDRIYARFSDAIQKAQAESELRDVALIARASQVTWQAAAWRLERKFPQRWGQRDRHLVEHHGTLGVSNIPPEDQQEYMKRLAGFFGESVDFEFSGDEDDAD